MYRTAWLVPIRFWEPAEYSPERVELLHTAGKRNWYAYHHGYGHDCYIQRDRVHFSWIAARRAQHRLASRRTCRNQERFEREWRELVAEFFS